MPSVVTPPTQPFTFRPVEPITPGHLDSDWQIERFQPGDIETVYRLKVARGMRQRVMIDATDNTAISLKVIDCTGLTVYTFTNPTPIDVPGNKDAAGDQLHTYLFKAANLSSITADGTYYLLLSVTLATGVYQAVTEPFLLANSHEGTMEVAWSNSENKGGIWYENAPVRFGMLIEGRIKRLKPQVQATTFRDQSQDLTVLKSDSFRNWTFFVGTTGEGIPEYKLDKLSWIFDLDFVLLKGKQYTRASESAVWEKLGDEDAATFAASLPVQEADGFEGFAYTDPRLKLFTAPSPPYALAALSINQNAHYAQLIPATSPGFIVDDGTEEIAMVAAINAGLGDRELYGTVTRTSGNIDYTNGPGENYRGASAKLYTTSFGFGFVSGGPFTGPFGGTVYPTLSLSLRKAGGIIDWGDGNIEALPYSVSITTLSHAYTGAAGTYQVRIFGAMEYISIQGASGLTGTLPAGLKGLDIINGSFPSNTFQFSILAPVLSTLESLGITNSGLTSAVPFNSYYLPKLKYIDFSGNAFTSNAMGALTHDAWYNATHQPVGSPVLQGGVFSVGGQTTGAKINATGITHKAKLEALFWNVNV